MQTGRVAAGLSQHVARVVDADHHPVSGHLAGRTPLAPTICSRASPPPAKIYGRPEEAYLLAAAVYFVLCYGLSSLRVRRLHKRIAIVTG
jgi:hypothetical protein